eukprot:553985-Pleurochrysis_carterae.AAC.1
MAKGPAGPSGCRGIFELCYEEDRTYLPTTWKRSLALLQRRAHDGGASVRAGGRNVLPTHHPP